MARLGEGPESSTWKKTKNAGFPPNWEVSSFKLKGFCALQKKTKRPQKKTTHLPKILANGWKAIMKPPQHSSLTKKRLKLLCKCAKMFASFVFTNFDYCSIHHWKLIWRFWHMFFWWRKYFLLGSGQWARYDELHRVRSWKLQMYFKKIIQRYLFHPVWTYFWSWYKLIIFHNASLISLILKSGEAW